MELKKIELEVRDGYALIRLNSPETMNALLEDLKEELEQVIDAVVASDEVGAVVLTGSGGAFSAGGDIKRFANGFEPLEGFEMMKGGQQWIKKLATLNMPVIAAVNGYAMGAGFCLALLCDIVLAGEAATFGCSFIDMGLIPDVGGTYILPRLVGMKRAKELVFTGRRMKGREAVEMGLANHVYPNDSLLEEACKLAAQFAKGPRIAYSLSKEILETGTNVNFERALELEAYAQSICFQTGDHREAARAFLEKRPPVFKGE